MSGIEIHQEPDHAYRFFAPCAAAMTFDIGDPVRIVTNQLADCIDDDTEILCNEIIGFACEPAEGTTAGSRATAAADGFGVVTNQMRTYWAYNAPGLLLRTRNFWAAAGASVQSEKDGTEIGDTFPMTAAAGTNIWGVENGAVILADAGEINPADSANFLCVAILDNDMNPIDAAATQTAGDGWMILKPIGGSQLDFGAA